jgi:hypothetical protein
VSLFTLILDWRSGTYLAQNEAGSVEDAVLAWAQSPRDDDPVDLGIARRRFLEQAARGEGCASPLEGLRNVWCFSCLIEGRLALLHIVGVT